MFWNAKLTDNATDHKEVWIKGKKIKGGLLQAIINW
jgi:hypothetical protein